MLLRQTLLYLPAQILSPLVQFAAVLVWAKFLTPVDLGTVALTIAMQEMCFAGFFGWWSRYTLRFIGKFDKAGDRLAFVRTEAFGISCSTIVQALVVTTLFLFVLDTKLPLSTVLLANAFMVTRSLNNYQAERARADGNIALYSIIQICGPVIGFAVGFGLLLRFGSSPSAVFAGYIVAQVVGLAVGIARSDFGRSWGRPSRAILRQAVTFGGVVMTASMLAIFAINAPRFIVSQTMGIAALGMFAVGYGLGLRASSFAVTLVTAGAYPLVVRKMEREGKAAAFEQLAKNMTLVVATVVPVALGLLAVNRQLVDVLVDHEYQAATLAVLPLATLGGLFRYLRAHTSDQVFLVCLAPGFSTAIAVIDLVVAVASAYLGIRWLGLEGAALGPMVSGLATLTVSFVLSRTRFGFSAPLGSFARIVAAALGMYVAVRFVPVPPGAVGLALKIVVGGLVYPALLFAVMGDERRMLTTVLLRRLGRKESRTNG